MRGHFFFFANIARAFSETSIVPTSERNEASGSSSLGGRGADATEGLETVGGAAAIVYRSLIYEEKGERQTKNGLTGDGRITVGTGRDAGSGDGVLGFPQISALVYANFLGS